MMRFVFQRGLARGIGLILAIAGGLVAASASAREAFVPISRCGLRADARIVMVSALDPHAPGGLLAALDAPGPKIVAFSVGGVIALDEEVEIATPFTTIAGETAPGPGITLTGASLRIRSHDICIRHLSVRTGPGRSKEENGRRDGIAIGGNPEKLGSAVERVLLENVSVSWGIDENVSVWHAGTSGVQIRSAIIAEALRNAGHPKGAHSMGMLVASDVTKVSVLGSIFAHNNDRNPRISPNAQVFMQENLIYNPGNMSTEVFLNCDGRQAELALLRNIYIPGEDTRRDRSQYVFVDALTRAPILSREACQAGFARVMRDEADEAQARRIYEERLEHAGSRPLFRNQEDARIIAGIRGRTGRIRDDAPAVEIASERAPAGSFVMPPAPFRLEANGELAIANALCKAHLRLGGLPFQGCTLGAPRP